MRVRFGWGRGISRYKCKGAHKRRCNGKGHEGRSVTKSPGLVMLGATFRDKKTSYSLYVSPYPNKYNSLDDRSSTM